MRYVPFAKKKKTPSRSVWQLKETNFMKKLSNLVEDRSDDAIFALQLWNFYLAGLDQEAF